MPLNKEVNEITLTGLGFWCSDNFNRYEWVKQVTFRELFKRLKFDNADKWYIQKPESVLENKARKILRDFRIQTNHPISARKPDVVLINKTKRTCHFVDFVVPVDHRMRIKESYKYLDSARELKETVKHERDSDIQCRCNFWNGSQNPGKETGRIEDQKKNWAQLDHGIAKKSLGDPKKVMIRDFSEKPSVKTGAKIRPE